ncbi:unnamed protein product, partial [marine sediment metagenome]
NEEEIVDAFGEFALGVKPGGVLIANGTDLNVAKVIGKLPADLRCETFGLDKSRPFSKGRDKKCNFYAQNIQLKDELYAFDVYHNGELLGATKITLPGRHNILNALTVVAIAVNAGLPCQQVL